MAKLLSGTYTSTYSLTINPTTVTSSGLIDVDSTTFGVAGIFGTSDVAWTVTNLGTVESTGTGGIGIELQGDGRIRNGSTASIAALINGATGIDLVGNGTVTNYGTIQATSGSAIDLQGQDAVINHGALLNSGDAGATIASINARTTVTNFSVIQNSVGNAIYLASGVVINNAGSLVEGAVNGTGVKAGVVLGPAGGSTTYSTAGTLTNFGTVTGFIGLALTDGGVVTNGSSSSTDASITGLSGAGIRVDGAAATVANFGTIAGQDIGIALDVGGKITNGSSTSSAATISGGSLGGIYVSGAPASITNFGHINGFFSGARLSAGGVVSNKLGGSISATNQGVGVFIGGALGTITNLGSIVGATGVVVAAGGLITNGSTANSPARISATPFGRAVVLGAGGEVINHGHIVGYRAVQLTNSGTVDNSTGGTIAGSGTGSIAISITGGAASVSNSGSIVGTSGVVVDAADTASVTIRNDGTISGAAAGAAIQFGGGKGTLIIEPGGVFHGKVLGGSAADTVIFHESGTLSVSTFSGFETFKLSSDAANKLTLKDANFAGVINTAITISGGNAGNTISAGSLTGADHTVMIGGAGADSFTGGAGDDVFKFTADDLGATDAVHGGLGTDTLTITSAGTITASKVNGVETFKLASGAQNTLTLSNANFSDVTGATITVIGGSDGNVLRETGVLATNAVVFKGGAGADVLAARQNTTLTGGSGADLFLFTTSGTAATPDTNTVTDFSHGLDKIAFSDAGFNLGVDEGTGTATPQAIDPTLFSSNTDGTFATTANRFAYNSGSGELFYDADGSGTAHASQAIGTLTNHPTLTASDLFFVS